MQRGQRGGPTRPGQRVAVGWEAPDTPGWLVVGCWSLKCDLKVPGTVYAAFWKLAKHLSTAVLLHLAKPDQTFSNVGVMVSVPPHINPILL